WAVPPKDRVKPSLIARLRREIQNISWQRLRRGTGMNRNIPDYDGRLPENYLFLPFQVENDSQLILHSPLVGADMGKFVEVCRGAARQVAADMRLVVKLHPANLKQVDYSDLMKRFPDVLFYKSGPIGELIEKSRGVITINSTVGLEALTYYKPVVTLGDNFYNVAGVVEHVTSLKALPTALAAALSRPVDKTKIDQLLYYLYAHYFAHGSWRDFSPTSCENVADKISSLLGASG
ncbi:MAG TPA: capsular biosynthesis protein, partial [Candidatus Tenderia sp.]|nr:capsular biosynthesis protein [Candidatus Tenderia sp.]